MRAHFARARKEEHTKRFLCPQSFARESGPDGKPAHAFSFSLLLTSRSFRGMAIRVPPLLCAVALGVLCYASSATCSIGTRTLRANLCSVRLLTGCTVYVGCCDTTTLSFVGYRGFVYERANMTVSECIATCLSLNYTFSGAWD